MKFGQRGGAGGGMKRGALGKKGPASKRVGGIRTNFVQQIAPPKIGGKK